jgi:hypothetical protein
MAGQLVSRVDKPLTGQDEIITIPVRGLSKGMYIVRVTDGKQRTITRKIIR